MQFDSGSVDVSGVDDRRGFGGGGLAIGGGGLGVVGLILYFVVQALGGGGGGGAGGLPGLEVPGGVQAGPAAGGESREELQRRCNAEGALQRHTDCRLIKVYNVADDVWRDEFARRGAEYRRPTLTFFSQSVRTGCGPASSSTGPFYCPADQRIYLDLRFLDQLQRQFGAPGQFAQAYIVAHEFGHHIQTISGTERKVRAAQQSNRGRANELSVRMELQADCYAGVWSRLADERGGGEGIALSRQDVAEAIQAAEAVGDDRIQERTQGRVDPESWTHGSAADRRTWFERGLSTGDVGVCDTFSAG
jgi:predicted metalloprotease